MTSDRVVVGFAEALAAVETIWSLQEAGYEVSALARRGTKPTAARIPGVELVPVTAPDVDLGQSIGDVRAALEERRPCVVMPLDDSAVFVVNAVDTAGAVVAGPTGAQARFALDKSIQCSAAAEAGLAVPPTRSVSSMEELENLTQFPLVLKPAQVLSERSGALRRPSSFTCADRAELDLVRNRWDGTTTLLAQPRFRGVGCGLFGIATTEGVRAWSAHERIRMMNPAGSGSSACRSAPVDRDLVPFAQSFLDGIAWRGLFMIEMLRDERGQTWFMELNGRPWGSMALARRTGLEYPAWAVELALDDRFRVPDPPESPQIVCRHLGREVVHVLSVLRGPRSKAIDDWPRIGGTLREVVRVRQGERWYNCRPGARGLFLHDAWRTISNEVRGST